MDSNNNNHGGRREGAGRPSLGDRKQKLMSLKLDADLVESICQIPNKNRFINDCIREKLDRLKMEDPEFRM